MGPGRRCRYDLSGGGGSGTSVNRKRGGPIAWQPLATANNCGGCGLSCGPPCGSNMTPNPCVGGLCLFGECIVPYADCDNDGLSCEVDLSNDPANCGVCQAVCTFGSCVDGICQ